MRRGLLTIREVHAEAVFALSLREALMEWIIARQWEKHATLVAQEAVLTALLARKIDVSDEGRVQILAQKDSATLQRWLERTSTAKSITDVIDEWS